MACMERSEDSCPELVFSFHHVGPKDWAQSIHLDCRHLYELSHLPGPWVSSFKTSSGGFSVHTDALGISI